MKAVLKSVRENFETLARKLKAARKIAERREKRCAKMMKYARETKVSREIINVQSEHHIFALDRRANQSVDYLAQAFRWTNWEVAG